MSVGTSMNPGTITPGERRAHPRKQIKSVSYVALSGGNGGIITNLSEGGMTVQAANAVMVDDLPRLAFLIGQTAIQVQTRGEVVWKSPSKTIAGVRFVGIPEETRVQIREWVADKEEKRPPFGREETGPRLGEIAKSASDRPSFRLTIPDVSKSTASEVLPAASPSSGGSVLTERGDLSGIRIKRIRARLKRYLVSERERIRLRDLVSQETATLRHFLAETEFPSDVSVTSEEVTRRLQVYETNAHVLVTIMSMGCFWGEGAHDSTWARIVEHVGNSAGGSSDSGPWIYLRSYPALLMLYAGGLAALAEAKYSALKALLFEPRFAFADPEQAAQRMKASILLESKKAADSELNLGRGTCFSARLYTYLRDPLREFVPFEADYDELFDRFEYLLALIWIDDNPESIKFDWVPTEAPLGRFSWGPSGDERMSISRIIAGEIAERGRDLPLLRAGFFGGSLQRLQAAQKRVDRLLASHAFAGSIEIPTY